MDNTEIKVHYMHLYADPFNKIKENTKKVEVRILDEKRKSIRVGDNIVFSLVNDPEEKINTQVTGIFLAKSFEELFKLFSSEDLGNITVKDMYKYYSSEEENINGVLGIVIKYIPDSSL